MHLFCLVLAWNIEIQLPIIFIDPTRNVFHIILLECGMRVCCRPAFCNIVTSVHMVCAALRGRCLIKTNINGRGSTGFGLQRWGRELSHAVKMIDNVIIQNGSNVQLQAFFRLPTCTAAQWCSHLRYSLWDYGADLSGMLSTSLIRWDYAWAWTWMVIRNRD